MADVERLAVPDVLPGDGSTRDPYAVEVVQPYGWSPDRHERERERDAQLVRLGEQLAPPPPSEADVVASARPFGWELARRRMFRDFDYAALERALAGLADVDGAARLAVERTFRPVERPRCGHAPRHGYRCDAVGAALAALQGFSEVPVGVAAEIGSYRLNGSESEAALVVALTRAVRYLDRRLPDPVAAPGPNPVTRRQRTIATLRDSRDEAMRRRAAEGATVAELCAEFSVSKSTVYAVVNGRRTRGRGG